jgi:hypothetical protein
MKLANSILKLSEPTLSFQHVLATATDLPPPGPAYYAARRALWLTPLPSSQARSLEPSSSRQKLENLLNSPGAACDDVVWKGGVEKVWKGLAAGGRLKRRLPLNLIIQIIHSAWLRDPDTWPPGAVAPEPDDIWDEVCPNPIIIYPPPGAPAEYPSGVTTPWTAVNVVGDQVVDDRRASGLVVPAP